MNNINDIDKGEVMIQYDDDLGNADTTTTPLDDVDTNPTAL